MLACSEDGRWVPLLRRLASLHDAPSLVCRQIPDDSPSSARRDARRRADVLVFDLSQLCCSAPYGRVREQTHCQETRRLIAAECADSAMRCRRYAARRSKVRSRIPWRGPIKAQLWTHKIEEDQDEPYRRYRS